MGLWVALTSGIATVAAGVPLAALGMSVLERGSTERAGGWWLGHGRNPRELLATAAVGGLIGGVLATRLCWSLALPAFLLSAPVGVVLATIDVRLKRLPYVFSVPMYAVCLVCFSAASIMVGDYGSLVRSILAGAVAFAGFLFLALTFAGQLGFGDVVLVGWLAMTLGWLGWDHVGLGLLTGLVLQAVGSVASIALWQSGGRHLVPMGPALMVGWFVGVMIGIA